MPMITPTASSNVAEMVPVRVLTCGTPDANLWPNGLPCANEAPCANGAPCAYGAVLSSSTAVPGLAGPWPADRSASGAVATTAGASTWAIGGVRRPTGAIVPGASTAVNFDQAADQPSAVSGHHSSGCERGPPTVKIP